MTFAAEIAKPNSERYPLVRITPRRNVTTQLVSEGGGVYGMTFTYDIAKIERNGTVLTKVTSAPVANDRWYVDTSGNLDIKLASAPSSTNVIVVFYNLYFTTGEYRVAYKTPTDNTSGETTWEPRLIDDVTAKQSFESILGGNLSSSISTLTLDNTDFSLSDFFTESDSWNFANVTFWVNVNEQLSFIATALVRSCANSLSKISLSLSDSFSSLDKKCDFGDDFDEVYYTSSAYPNCNPNDLLKPIPVYFARQVKPVTDNQNSPALLGIAPKFGQQNIGLATCIDYSSSSGSGENLEWILGKIPAGVTPDTTLTIGTITYVYGYKTGTSAFDNHYIFVQSTGGTLRSGMTGVISDSSPSLGTRCAYVAYAKDFNFDDGGGSKTYQYVIGSMYLAADGANVFSDSLTFTPQSIGLFIRRKSNELSPVNVAFYDSSSSITYTTTTSGSRIYKLTVPSTSVSATSAVPIDPSVTNIFSPDTHDLLVSFNLTGLGDAGDVLNTLYESATGDTLDGSALTANTNFSIPMVGETDVGSYRSYIEKLLTSSAAFLHETSSGVVADVLSVPSASTVISDGDYRNLSVKIDYQDVITKYEFINNHMSGKIYESQDDFLYSLTDQSSVHQNASDKSGVLYHILETIEDQAAKIHGLSKNRRAIYSFETSTKLLAANVGDNITLESDIVLGGSGSVNLKIISLDKSASGVFVEATDLLGL